MKKVRVICNSETLDVVNLLNNGKPSAKTGTVLGCICSERNHEIVCRTIFTVLYPLYRLFIDIR